MHHAIVAALMLWAGAAQAQVVHFIETGEVIQTCEGVCSGTVQPCESD